LGREVIILIEAKVAPVAVDKERGYAEEAEVPPVVVGKGSREAAEAGAPLLIRDP
jgi:hypothetical protein